MGFDYIFDMFFGLLGSLYDIVPFYWMSAAGVVFAVVSLIFYLIRGDKRA